MEWHYDNFLSPYTRSQTHSQQMRQNLQRWLIRFVPLIDQEVRKRKKPVGSSWRMDETYIKINGKWVYLYRAVDSCGNTIEFLLRQYRDARHC